MIRRLAPTLLLLAAPAAAQRVPPADSSAATRLIAAGYKAMILCNGVFVAGRSEAQVAADELAGIYPEIAAIVPILSATINRDHGVVSVPAVDGLPPRIAAYGAETGCTTLPVGADMPDAIARPLPAPAGASSLPWPQGDRTSAVRASAALDRTVAGALDGETFGKGAKTTGVVVLRGGRIVVERYAAGWGPYVANRTWSAAKSIAGTLIGVAKHEGAALDPDAPAGLAAWAHDSRASITLDNLLRMASGLHSGAAGNRTDALYTGLTAVDQEATAWPVEARPGTRFRYANDDILLATLALRERLGETRYRGLPGGLFLALGMTHTVAERDWHGNYLLSSQVWSTARDLARLGQFWLQDGVWQGKRLLPEGWVRYMTTPSGPQPADGPGYGATMWLFGPKQGLPVGSYAAQGNRGQFVMVVPSERLVVVRRGEDPGAARFDIAGFTARVIEALR